MHHGSRSSSRPRRGRSGLVLLVLALCLLELCGGASLTLPTAMAEETRLLGARQDGELSDLEPGDRIRVNMKNGSSLEGSVVEISGFALRLKHKFGVAEIERQDILSWEKFRTNPEIFEERAAECSTADEWCDLGDWAKEQGESDLSTRAYREATKLDPASARAREALGEVEVEGEWVPFEEAMRRQGKEFYRGEWRTPEEIAELEREEEDARRNEKLKGRRELEMEYKGRPWAAIDPIITPNYEIWCNSTEELAQYYADVMEALYKKYDKVFPKKFFPRNSTARSVVYIHANHQQFMDWTANGPGTGGFYNLLSRNVTAYHGSFGTTGSTEEVLAHEGTHQFEGLIFDNLRALPMWFIEGLAVYFGDGSKITRRNVEINEIPRDRLVGLKQAIEDGTYCELKDLLRITQPRFSGFYYGHGWGVIYWCLWGHKMGAGNGDSGSAIMDDWLIKCRTEAKKDEPCDYEAMATYFEQLIVRETGKSLAEWEEDYKEWILGLPVEEVGKRRGASWISEALKLEVKRPSGWGFVKDTELASDEVVAMTGPGSQVRRISTYCWPNWQHADMNLEYAKRLSGNIFQNVQFPTGESWVETEVGGYPAIRGTFTGKRILQAETTIDDQGQPTTNVELGGEQKYDVVYYGSIDKIYANVFECQPDMYDDQHEKFVEYLENFRIDN